MNEDIKKNRVIKQTLCRHTKKSHQVFPPRKHERVLPVHDSSKAAFDWDQDVTGLETEDGEGEKALAKVEKAV